jgi:restriction endonuclease S subunit
MHLLKDLAEIHSGIYLNNPPGYEVAYLQIKDLLMDSTEKIASFVEYNPKMEKNLLQKGDLLFAGKGTTYLCTLFNLDIKAVASTTLYIIRVHNNKVLPEYLCWYLNHPNIVSKIRALQIGSSTPLIHKSTLEELEIPVPEIFTQWKVMEISRLQKRETYLTNTLAEKRASIVNQLLINEIKK